MSALVLLKEADPPLAVAVCVTEKEVVALLVAVAPPLPVAATPRLGVGVGRGVALALTELLMLALPDWRVLGVPVLQALVLTLQDLVAAGEVETLREGVVLGVAARVSCAVGEMEGEAEVLPLAGTERVGSACVREGELVTV